MPEASQLNTYARLLHLTPVDDVATPLVSRAPATPEPALFPRRWPKGLASFFVWVVLPVCLAGGYLGLLAADRYESEARFVVRMPASAMSDAAMTKLFQSTGPTRSNDNGYIVQEFLESRDAMAWLVTHAGLRAAYEKGGWDIVWRFPNPFSSNTDEGLYKHYQRMMSAMFDSTTGLNSLKVQAFTPADAERLAASLLEAAEALVNRLNERGRKDAMELAESEADRMRRRVLAAQTVLTEFRDRERLIDPTQSTLAVLEAIGKLSIEAAQVGVQISELGKSASESPQIAPLRGRQAALEAQILLERQRLAGDAKSIAPRIAEYERLMLDREFAQNALMAAMTAVETARVDGLRQHIYLERVAAPGRPDYPVYPIRILWALAIAAAGYMMWRIWLILAADVMDHTVP